MYVCVSMSVHHRFLVEIILNHSSVSTLQMQYLFLSVRYLNQLSCMIMVTKNLASWTPTFETVLFYFKPRT